MRKVILSMLIAMLFGQFTYSQVDLSKAKAIFVHNFTKFIEWPIIEREGDFVIGVIGSNDVYSNLNTQMGGKSITGQKVSVKKFKSGEEADKCHVLYIAGHKLGQLDAAKSKTGKHTLVISDGSKGIEKGAGINFVVRNDKLAYQFNGENIKSNGLKYHSKLVSMSTK